MDNIEKIWKGKINFDASEKEFALKSEQKMKFLKIMHGNKDKE